MIDGRPERAPGRPLPVDAELVPADREGLHVVAEGQAEIDAPQLDEAAIEDRGVDQDRERRPEAGDAIDHPAQAARQCRMHAGVALARDGRVGLVAEPEALRIEGAQREHQQHERQDRRQRLVVLGADDGEEYLGRQHVEIAAEHQRVAEIGHALDEAEQEGVGEARPHQRQRYRPERLPAVGAQGLRRLLHRRADAFDDADQHQEGDRREGQHLRDQQPGQAIDPARRLHVEQMRRQPWVTAPDRPNSRMIARPMTKGGVMIGSTVSARSILPYLKPVRVTTSANTSPIAVVSSADDDRQEERVPGDAAARAAGDAACAPQPLAEQLCRGRSTANRSLPG